MKHKCEELAGLASITNEAIEVSWLLLYKQIDETGQLSPLNIHAFSMPGNSGFD